MIKLAEASLFKERCYIDGHWIESRNAQYTDILNPATRERLGQVPFAGAEETRHAIRAAETALPAWSARTAKDRAAILARWHDLMLEHQEDLARIMTAEQGKPLAEARGEITYAASYVAWFAEEAKRVYGDIIPATQADKRILVTRQPIGVVAAITPWNFPTAMITRKAAPALAAGCTFVCKPAPQTPFSALALAALAERAGVPPGVLNIVTGDAPAIGGEMTSNPVVRKLSFTGSTALGRRLMAQCAPTLKKLSLELGGNAPFIVFEDADLDAAVEGAMISKFRNTGQTCVCANRLLVHEAVYEDFCERLAAAVRKLRVGNGFEADINQGPLIDDAALRKVERHIQDALAKGGRVKIGGERHPLGGTFFQPTVIVEANDDMQFAREETFGPVAPVFRFRNDSEAIRMANATEFGLAAYFYTRDLSRAFRVSEQLQYGMVGLNTGLISTEVAPFGGIKQSGFGREGSRYGLQEYTELKYLCIAV
jgi:succinate-semialdehyde dehydrogenase/glutarate-semialdehyde dehydrogenase